MKRRHFFRIAAAGSAAAALSATTWATSATAGAPHARDLSMQGLARNDLPLQELAAPRLLDLLGSPEAVRNIGRAYRKAHPSERSVDALSHALLSDARLSDALSDALLARRPDRADIRRRLDEQIRAEFDLGQTVRLQGWVLSQTEARQAALYSILS